MGFEKIALQTLEEDIFDVYFYKGKLVYIYPNDEDRVKEVMREKFPRYPQQHICPETREVFEQQELTLWAVEGIIHTLTQQERKMSKKELNIRDEIDYLSKLMIDHESYAYAAGYLGSMLVEALEHMPKRKREQFLSRIRNEFESRFTAKVKSLMSGKEVEIPLRDVGTVCDPSQERYWTA